MSSRPNFYILLNLDPNARWDDAAYHKALQAARAEWTRLSRTPHRATESKRNLELVPKIREVMNDPVLRQNEAEEATRLLKDQTQQAQRQFDERLGLLQAKGFATDDDVQMLAADLGLDMSDVRQRVEKRGLELRLGPAPVNDADALEASTMTDIQSHLDVLGKQNLYDFLGMTRTVSTSILLAEANRLYDNTLKKATRDAQVTATSVLAGHGMAIFKTEAERGRYDRALEDQRYAAIFEESLKHVARNTDRTLYAGQVQRLLMQAREASLDVDRADAYIRRRARQLGIAVEFTDTTPVKEQQVCPACGALLSKDADTCSNCGTPLHMTCPGCGETIPTEDNVCRHCQFPLGELFVIRHELDDAGDFVQQGRYDLADSRFRSAQSRWNKLPNIVHNNPVVRDLRVEMHDADTHLQEHREQIAELRRLIDEKRFYAARQQWRDIEAAYGSDALGLEYNQIETAIAQAESRLKQARAASGDDAVQRYLEILADCADCEAATDALARIPPSPPNNLVLRRGGAVISLEWDASPSDGVKYIIVRRRHALPNSAADGEQLVTQAATRYDDTAPLQGVPYYYGVFAERGGIQSHEGALATEPILLTPPVSELTAKVASGQVHLQWEAPPNVKQVVVVRGMDSAPDSPDAGEPVHVLDTTQAVDAGLDDDVPCHYGVFPQYLNHDGVLMTGPGQFISATPQPPPGMITHLDFAVTRREDYHELVITWEPPERGDVAILGSFEPFPFSPGYVMPESDLATYGELTVSRYGQAEAEADVGTILYFTPVILLERMAYIGKTHDYAALEDVSNLRVLNQGTELHIHWDWPPNCRKVILAYSHTNYPAARADELSDVTRLEITRAQFDIHGYYVLKNPAERDYYIGAFAVISGAGTELVASGHNARTRISLSTTLEIRFEINRTRRNVLQKGPFQLKVRYNGGGHLPEMVLVRRQGAVPLKRTEGQVIHTIAARELEGTRGTIIETLAEDIERPQSYINLFLVDEVFYQNQGGNVRILLPDQNKLKVF